MATDEVEEGNTEELDRIVTVTVRAASDDEVVECFDDDDDDDAEAYVNADRTCVADSG